MSENTTRVGLIGCVKQKADHAAPARELYTSTLYRGRRAFVGKSCDTWFILSAKHGLVTPDEVLEPYDESLSDMPATARRAWAQRVLAQIDTLGLTVARTTFEIHAGANYRSFGLTSGLEARGARVEVVAEHLGQGEQLAFYAHRTSPRGSLLPISAEPNADLPSTGPYSALAHHLAGVPEQTAALSFADLERLLARALPASARKYRAWWSNERGGTHTQARAWIGVGWLVDHVDLRGERVVFRRGAT